MWLYMVLALAAMNAGFAVKANQDVYLDECTTIWGGLIEPFYIESHRTNPSKPPRNCSYLSTSKKMKANYYGNSIIDDDYFSYDAEEVDGISVHVKGEIQDCDVKLDITNDEKSMSFTCGSGQINKHEMFYGSLLKIVLKVPNSNSYARDYDFKIRIGQLCDVDSDDYAATKSSPSYEGFDDGELYDVDSDDHDTTESAPSYEGFDDDDTGSSSGYRYSGYSGTTVAIVAPSTVLVLICCCIRIACCAARRSPERRVVVIGPTTAGRRAARLSPSDTGKAGLVVNEVPPAYSEA